MRIPYFLRLAKANFEITALGTGNPRPFAEHGLPYLGYSLHRFLNPLSDLGSLRELVELIRTHRPHIVHGFDTKPSLLASLAVHHAGIGCAVRTINGMGYVFSSRSPVALALRPVYRALQRYAAPKTAMTIFQNEQDWSYFKAHGLVADARGRLIRGSGIDLDDFGARLPEPASIGRLRHELGLEGKRVVTVVSRMTRLKGIPTLLKATTHLASRYQDVVFLLVGPREAEGPMAVPRNEVERHAPFVRALGQRTDVPALLALTDVFVLPTQYREGIPRVLLEAGAAGCAMVTTKMPGCSDVVRDGWNGLLVEPGDAGALAHAIETLIERPDLRCQMGERSRLLVRTDFSLERVVQAYKEVYDGVLHSQMAG